jgi:hypothetical protein
MIINDLFSKKQRLAEGGIATVSWPDEGNRTSNNTPVSVGGTFDARPVVKRGSLVKASGLTGVYRVMDILRDEAKIVQEIPMTGQSTYVPMSDLRVWTNKPIKEQGMAEGQLELNTPDPVVVVQDQQGKILDKVNLSVAAQKYKLGQPQNIKNQLAHQNYTKIGNYTIVSPMTGQPQDATTQGVAEGMDGQVVFSGTGADGGKYEIIQSSPTDFMIHANGKHIDTYGSLQRAMSVLKNEVPGLQQGMAEGDSRHSYENNYVILDPDGKVKAIKQNLEKARRWLLKLEKQFGPGYKIRPVDNMKNIDENIADDIAAAAQKKFPNAYISKNGQEVQKPENWGKRYTPPAAAPADLEKQQRDLTAKYPNIDELVRKAELNRDPDYEMADGQAYYAARDAEQNYQKLRQIQRVIQGLNESLNRSHLP